MTLIVGVREQGGTQEDNAQNGMRLIVWHSFLHNFSSSTRFHYQSNLLTTAQPPRRASARGTMTRLAITSRVRTTQVSLTSSDAMGYPIHAMPTTQCITKIYSKHIIRSTSSTALLLD